MGKLKYSRNDMHSPSSLFVPPHSCSRPCASRPRHKTFYGWGGGVGPDLTGPDRTGPDGVGQTRATSAEQRLPIKDHGPCFGTNGHARRDTDVILRQSKA